MRIDIITLFPEQLEAVLSSSILGRAQTSGHLQLHLHNLRDYSEDKWGRVDDYPYGGDAGMVLRIEPVAKAIESLQGERAYDEVIFCTPDAEVLTQKRANQLSLYQNLLFLCGHYKGIDQRIRDHFITLELSVGDYVLTGGGLPVATVVDATVRLLPGVLGDAESALSDSFQDGLLAPPLYTRPDNFRGWKVPEVLLSGHAAKISQWQEEEALRRTQTIRPDLLEKLNPTK